jgi:uncharacterized protein YndB with AHSA1/START domain
MTDRIDKQIEPKAPAGDHGLPGIRRVVPSEAGGPFLPGQQVRGQIMHPGYEHLTWEETVKEMQPERLFSFTWHPYAIDPTVDYSCEPTTLVEFRLEQIPGGTLLVLTESGFDVIPAHRQSEALRMNDDGWTQQMKNIEKHVA